MTQLELIAHVEKYVTIKFRDLLYSYDKLSKHFKAKDGQKMSLEYALTHADEICAGWLGGIDYSKDKDQGVIATFNGETIVDVKTGYHL